MITGCEGSVVTFWDLKTGRQARHVAEAHGTEEISCMSMDPTGCRLMTGDRTGNIHVSHSSLQLASLLGHSLKINVLNFIRLLASLLGHSHACKINVRNFIRLLASLLGHSRKINVLSFIRLLASLLGHRHEIKVLNFIIFLNPRVGKINRILCFVSLAERARWVHRQCGSRQKKFSLWPYN